jgi:hypothetical protein
VWLKWCLFWKHKVLSSNPSLTKKKEEEEEEEEKERRKKGGREGGREERNRPRGLHNSLHSVCLKFF